MRGIVASCNDFVRHSLGQRLEHGIETTIGRQHARTHRCRINRVDQTARGRRHGDRALHPFVERNICTGQRRLNRSERCRDRRCPRAVQVAPDLRASAIEIDMHRIALNRHFCFDHQWFVTQPVIVDRVFTEIFPIGYLPQGGPEASFGVVDQLSHRSSDAVGPVFLTQLLHALGADGIGGKLGIEIADRLIGNTNIGRDQPLQRSAVPVP